MKPASLSRAVLVVALASLLQPLAPVGAAPQQSAPPPVSAAAAAATPEPDSLKVLTLADYPRWSRINEVALSPDGRWMTYAYDPNEGDATFHVRDLNSDAVFSTGNGAGPAFSDDSAWLGYFTSPPDKEAAKLRKAHEPVPRTLHLRDLGSGEETEFRDIARFAFAEDSGHLAALRTREDRKAEHLGADLMLRHLPTGMSYTFGNIAEFAFNDAGMLLAYVVDAADPEGNGVYVMNLKASTVRPLDSGSYRYTQLTWDEDGKALAVLRGNKADGKVQRDNTLLAWLDLDGDGVRTVSYEPAVDPEFPADMVLSELGELQFSDDRSRIFLGIKEQLDEVPESDAPESNVEVWHWKDDRVQSVQKVQATRDEHATWRSVLMLEPEPHFIRLADEQMRSVTPTDDGLRAIGALDAPYRSDRSVEGGRADYYDIDTTTGERTLIAGAMRRPMGTSPDSQWFLYLKDGEVQAYGLGSGERHNLSRLARVDFVNRRADMPMEKPAYGIAGWSSDGTRVLLNHDFDLWSLPLGAGEAMNLTAGVGEAQQIHFRVARLDPDSRKVDLSQPVLLSAYGEWTKQSGYWSVLAGSEPTPLLWQDRMIGSLRKAEDADRVVFTQQTFTEFPDQWTSDLSFTEPVRVTDANPQQAEYAWSPGRVLIDYVDKRGNKLQATLTLPAGYEPGKRYPTLVYFYEKMSQRHHQYSMPVYDDRPHMSTYASDGYAVLMPDIVYDDGLPGSSALDDVNAAVHKAIDLGYVDADHIGLQGHSWGGYESSFILTQTDMFAAIVTGAPLTDLVSMYNILYKRTGSPNGPILEWSQGRMATDIWKGLDQYISQSPVHHADQITTPFLILQGTEDGAVDWNQGLELYTAARRLGKKVILLSYPGEPHHLSKVENQKDFQLRMKQFFDHYLLGREAPEWMRDGVAYLERDRKRLAIPGDEHQRQDR